MPGDVGVMEKVCSTLEQYLDCNVLKTWFLPPASLREFFVDISDPPGILDLLSTIKVNQFACISQQDRGHLANYMAMFLQPTADITKNQQRTLGRLPIYRRYNTTDLEPLNASEKSVPSAVIKQRRLARGYNQSEHPWLSQSVDLFADDQPMREHLRAMLSVSDLPESEYWHVIVKALAERHENDGDADAIMAKLAPTYHVHCTIYDLASILRKLPFVLTTTAAETQSEGSNPSPACRLSLESVVHPSLSAYYPNRTSIFPTGIYCLPPLFGILSELGMYSSFDATFVEKRLKALFSSGGPRMEENREMLEALYGRLNSECSERFLSPELISLLKTVPWVYTGSDSGWRTPGRCRPQKDRALIGDKMPLAEFAFTNDALLSSMGWKSGPPLKIVLDNLFSIIDKHTHHRSANTASSPELLGQESNHVGIDSIDIRPIYQYLSDKIKDPAVFKDVKERLQNKPWVLVSGNFYLVDQVALKMHCDLHPHFVQLPTSNLNDFYLELGVQEHIRQEDVESTISTIASKYQDREPLSDMDADLVYRLLSAIADGENTRSSADLLLLTEDGGLKRAADVVYDDVNVRQGDYGTEDMPYAFLHRRISHEMAKRLLIDTFSERSLQDCRDNLFDPFFQQESIVDRIKGILNDYDPSSIFNEFLQNASDAGATECRFWLDLNRYGTEKVFSEQMAAWQGPALMIYNNAEFSDKDKDFDALCRLGVGNKKENTSKIGRHGLGFNSVYHFTDVPSIVSGSNIGFLDPLMTNLPKSLDRNGIPIAKGGLRCDFRKLNMETHGDQLAPYEEILGSDVRFDMKSHFNGTLFRLPLRKISSEASAPGAKSGSTAATDVGSGFGDGGLTVERIQMMMKGWVEDAKVGMLFLKNIKTIRIMNRSTTDVTVKKTEMSKIERTKTSKSCTSLNSKTPHPPDSIVKVEVFSGDSASSQMAPGAEWLICCDDTLPSNTPKDVRKIAAESYRTPHRGVAILLQNTGLSEFQSQLFVHLPTTISTSLPFHINGDFSLTSNRKSLAGGNEGDENNRIWNSFLIGKCLPETTVRAMELLVTMCPVNPSSPGRNRIGITLTTDDYFKQWPIKPTREFLPFFDAFLRQAHSSPVFPCTMQPTVGKDTTFLSTGIIPPELGSKVIPWLREQTPTICIVPGPVMSVIATEWSKERKMKCEYIDGDFIRRCLSQTPDFIKDNMKTSAEREWILGLAYQPVLHPEVKVLVSSDSLQILPLLNGEWKSLAGDGMYYVATEHERGLLRAEDILIDEDVFSNKELNLVLDKLIEDYMYNVEMLPDEVFASTFLKENPGSLTGKQVKQLWDYIEDDYDDLDTFLDFPILKTAYGTMTTLKKARNGFQISGLPSQSARKFIAFMDLLQELDIPVYDSSAHRNHQFFKEKCLEYSDHRLLNVIVTRWGNSSHPKFTRDEAAGLRELVLACSGTTDRALILSVGELPIWKTQGSTDSSPLIAASGAYYLEGHFDLEGLGEFSKVLCSDDVDDVRIFKAMDAAPLRIAAALTDFVLPKFHSGLLKCEGYIKSTYLDLLRNLFYVCQLQGKGAAASRNVVNTAQCFVARDGSFHRLHYLVVPGETLTESLFEDQPEKFADKDMVMLMSCSIRSIMRSLVTHPKLVLECAEKVLAETLDASANPGNTRVQAFELVKYIYENPEAGGIDWMDAKWKFVPRRDDLEWPYNIKAPVDLPLYMAFSDLVDFSKRDVIWTQRGFFHGDLIPSKAFKTRYPEVQTTNVAFPDVLKHLNVLVRDIAPLWTSTSDQYTLRSILSKVYDFIERHVGNPNFNREWFANHSKSYLQVPYILNGEATTWIWPAQLMFGIDSNIPSHQVVDPKLHEYRNFLLVAGASEIVPVVGEVDVEAGREQGFMEDHIMRRFENQNKRTGFMDIRFKFKEGSDILAHKVVVASASRFTLDPLTRVRSSSAIMDPEALVAETVDLSDYGDIRGAFWGLLYYFYSDKLIQSNGGPVLKYQEESGEPVVAEKSGSDDDEGVSGDRQRKQVKDELAQRVQYLMDLQYVAHQFEVSRLKDLIAQELIMGQKVIHSNVFSIRDHAERNQADNVRKHCDLFIKKNKASVIKYVEGRIHELEVELEKLGWRDESLDEFFECEDTESSDAQVEERERERMIQIEYHNRAKLLLEKLEEKQRNLMELLKEP
ncbi:hypothetical protein BGZ96_002045 [Linnemannia gamsii]|uniref:BTB domain-containing protein n=1 Tax=Linnemannia gamsii TaxID=64522 RepID=A0ABQ7KAB5_9FUNG|nr:hypothetical protein BGZ96_002045 [Linnemannia gamsii]